MKPYIIRVLIVSSLIAALCASNSASTPIPQDKSVTVPKLSIAPPDGSWALVFDAKDFDVKTNGLQPDGRIYLLAQNQKSSVMLSVYLSHVSGAATESDCDKTEKERLDEKVEYKRDAVVTRKADGMAIVEFTIPEFRGVPVQQRNLFACIPKDDVYVDIHLSKVSFKPQDEKLFTDILNSAHFVQKP